VLFLSLAMQLYLGWHFIQTILTWRRQRAEVELAQKKADNFWQNKLVLSTTHTLHTLLVDLDQEATIPLL